MDSAFVPTNRVVEYLRRMDSPESTKSRRIPADIKRRRIKANIIKIVEAEKAKGADHKNIAKRGGVAITTLARWLSDQPPGRETEKTVNDFFLAFMYDPRTAWKDELKKISPEDPLRLRCEIEQAVASFLDDAPDADRLRNCLELFLQFRKRAT